MFDAKPQRSCFDLSQSGQRGGKPDSTVPNCVSGTKPVLFSLVCGQSHSEASGPKVSWSIILILHCKQTGSILFPRCIPDTEISSLSAVDKDKCLKKADALVAEFPPQQIQSPADSKEEYGPMSCYVLCKILQFPEKVVRAF